MLYIIGAGAIGKALAVFLTVAGKKVTLVRGSVDNQPDYVETIRVGLDEETTLEADVLVTTFSNRSELDGTLVLTNKSYGNERLAQVLKGNGSPIVLLQNGLGVEQVFIDHGFSEVYRCVLFATSQLTSERDVKFKPVAESPIGIIKGTMGGLQAVVDQLHNPVFRFKTEHVIQPIIWKKAIVNSVFNSICPLLEMDNGVFHRNEAALAMARRVIRECVTIARESGVTLTVDEVVENLLMISRFSDGQYISTWQDILHRRPTEIDTLNFEIVRKARALNRENEVSETKLLGELIRLKSDLKRAPSAGDMAPTA